MRCISSRSLRCIRVEEVLVRSQVDHVPATTITFSFAGPADSGGLPIRKYAVQYKEERKDWRDARNKTWPVGMCTLWSKVRYSVMIPVSGCGRNAAVVLS
jgi:hypothetical protein